MKRKYIPYPFYWDNVPIDISFIFEGEKPAGKHGFLKVEGENFVFEDGTKAKFWGTNFNSGLNFPPFDFSKKISKRLAKLGINLVRFHQMDAEWSTPNIFQFTKGKRKGNTLSFDPESIKRLDYLIYCLKKEGIYIYMDMLTYRKFKVQDGVENALELADAARPYCIFNRTLIELQKKYNYDLWNHINPYTGLAYKDDPAIVLTEIINEGDMFSRPTIIPYYKKELDKTFAKWLKKENIENLDPDLSSDLNPHIEIKYPSNNPIILQFLIDVQESYYKEMIDHLRKIGVKIPITGTNWAINTANRKTQLVTDFGDGHTYWYGWKWQEEIKEFQNNPMVRSRDTMIPSLTFSRHVGRAYFVSEWDEPWPNEWRAESPIYMAAIGAFQNWGGFAIHTYSYTSIKDIQITGKEVTSNAIGSVPYREGVFNTWNDPGKFGLFYHSALLLRRGDVKVSNNSYGIKVEDMSLKTEQIPALSLITEKHKAGMLFEECSDNESYDAILPVKELALNNLVGNDIEDNNGDNTNEMEVLEVLSDTKELYRNWEKGIGWVDSDRTKAVYGFVGKVPKIELTGVSFDVETDFATIAMSSLTDKPLSKSDNILLTTVGRSKNTNMQFNKSHNKLLDIGVPPILVEVIEAEIILETEISTLRIWAVNAEGFFSGVIPSSYENGMLKFRLGKNFASMYYLIQAE